MWDVVTSEIRLDPQPGAECWTTFPLSIRASCGSATLWSAKGCQVGHRLAAMSGSSACSTRCLPIGSSTCLQPSQVYLEIINLATQRSSNRASIYNIQNMFAAMFFDNSLCPKSQNHPKDTIFAVDWFMFSFNRTLVTSLSETWFWFDLT